LDEGHVVGLIAGTDHGGEGLTAYRNGEMFSARVTEFTRDGICEALKKHRTVALTHSRVLLHYTVNGIEMGTLAAIAPDVTRVFKIKAAARPYPARIDLIRNSESCATFNNVSKAKNVIECELTDSTVLEKRTWYLVRVTLHGGERCWSSPVWLAPEQHDDLQVW
jgi:hypothetical protein